MEHIWYVPEDEDGIKYYQDNKKYLRKIYKDYKMGKIKEYKSDLKEENSLILENNKINPK